MSSRIIIFLLVSLGIAPLAQGATKLTLEQALARVLQTYPSLPVAQMQLQRASLENQRAESQLGWLLTGQAGSSRDLSIIGSPTDRVDLGAGIQRKFSSGATLGLEGTYTREDSETNFVPSIPNPLDTTNLDLSLRQPLARGLGNPDYKQALIGAEAQVQIAEADSRTLYDQVSGQLIEIYYAAASTYAGLENAQRAIERAQRLKRYIQGNMRLGIAEQKDLLQAEARRRARIAEYSALEAVWQQQRTSLNRLMGQRWDQDFVPQYPRQYLDYSQQYERLLREVKDYNPDLLRQRSQVQLAETEIVRRRDAYKDSLDLVLSLGNRNRSGDDAIGSNVDESENVGGIRLEYQRSLDKRGVDAELIQAQLDRDIAQQELRTTGHDLGYNLSSLLAGIKATDTAVEGYVKSVSSEQSKMNEAVRRYRNGRTDTNILIQFEEDLHFAELTLEQQRVDLARKHAELALLRGKLWQGVQGDAALSDTNSKQEAQP